MAVRLDDRDQRVRLGLSFLDGRKIVDVSTDPSSWVRCLRSAAQVFHEPQMRWADALSTGLRRVGIERGWWNALPEQLDPEVTAAAAAWPLARPAIEAGFDERTVPRWAVPLLAAPDVATGSRTVLGNRSDRRVIREMARALSGPVRWWSIACAVALEQLDAGRVGNLLAGSTSTYRCSQDERMLLTRTLGTAHPNVAQRLLLSAEQQGGPQRLLAALDGWQRITTHRRPLPNRLDRLETEVLAELEVAPEPQPRPVPQREVQVAQLPIRQRQGPAAMAARILEQHVPRTILNTPDLFEHRPRWRQLHHARGGSVELILPRGRGDLVQWGEALSNCLGGYGYRVEQNATVILGVRHDQRLVGAVEIDPSNNTIRQLEGRNNRQLEGDFRRDALALLAENGVSVDGW